MLFLRFLLLLYIHILFHIYRYEFGDLCISDNGSTHTILKSEKYFSELKPTMGIIRTISGPADMIEGIGTTHFLLPNGTKFLINNALFSPKSTGNL